METLKKAQAMRATYSSRSVFQPNLGINQQFSSQDSAGPSRGHLDKDLSGSDQLAGLPDLQGPTSRFSKDSASSTVSRGSRQEEAAPSPILERDQMIVSDSEGKRDRLQTASADQTCLQGERVDQRSEHGSFEDSSRCGPHPAEEPRSSPGEQERGPGEDCMEEEASCFPGEALLCVVEGQDKENIAPLKVLIDEQQKVHSVADSSDHKMMDEDKEPVFAEENLDRGQPLFEDAPSEPRDPAEALAESPISERNVVIVASPPAKPQRAVPVQPHPQPASRQSSQRRTPPSSISFKPNPQLHKPTTPNLKAASKGFELSFRARQQASNLTPSKSKDILKPKPTNTPRTSELKSLSPALQKRPPLFEKKEPISKPSAVRTPISAIALQKDRIKARLYQTVSKPSSELSKLLKPQTPVAATTEKQARNASLTRLHRSPSSKQKLLSDSDSKICPKIAARQAEAEKVLLQKKPPIPKFNLQARGDSKQRAAEGPAELPRKPAVPKLSELIKKRSGL